MNRRFALLTKLLVLVSLILASVPSGATETVCVVGAKKQVVAMRKCGMPCCAHRLQPTAKAACCKPKAAPRETCGSGLSCHCETRYVAVHAPAPVAETKLPVAPVAVALLDAPLRLVRVGSTLVQSEIPIFGSDAGPPRKVPRSPMRGRAPPVANP